MRKPLMQYSLWNVPQEQGVQEAKISLERRLTFVRQRLRRLNIAKKNLEEATGKLEAAFKELDGDTQRKEEESFSEYGAGATDEIIRIEKLDGDLAEMEILVLEELQNRRTQEEQTEQASRQLQRRSEQPQTGYPLLPSLQGKPGDNIHDQPISNIAKFNYLLKAVSGEIQETMTRFQISETGYEEAITWLQSRFGREDVIVEQLYAKLEKLQAEGQTTTDQRKLLDQVATTMTQLASKGQDVNHMQVLNQVFRKFGEQVQIKALKRRIKLPSASMWT
ncbi:hypothetical protein ANCCEY_09071 [Ancylostoma ceylanicum]|uniref:Uncharacterized protein n=1 Tax=Ancylostoma ceylanicum TaxID=53326 RepID=A0A0D6LL43_9BILA|nr:hypothetical protein ANCCEY_09071 [Ancylostoma ceylanicum]